MCIVCESEVSDSAGNVPPKANLGDLRGLAGGLDAGGSVMIDGEAFDGAKAYKDSKVHTRYARFSLCSTEQRP